MRENSFKNGCAAVIRRSNITVFFSPITTKQRHNMRKIKMLPSPFKTVFFCKNENSRANENVIQPPSRRIFRFYFFETASIRMVLLACVFMSSAFSFFLFKCLEVDGPALILPTPVCFPLFFFFFAEKKSFNEEHFFFFA